MKQKVARNKVRNHVANLDDKGFWSNKNYYLTGRYSMVPTHFA